VSRPSAWAGTTRGRARWTIGSTPAGCRPRWRWKASSTTSRSTGQPRPCTCGRGWGPGTPPRAGRASPPMTTQATCARWSRSAALVGMNGSIDWYCFPAFDSPSVFGAILDDKKGGQFSIAPATEHAAKKQFYWPDTNVLVTRFFSADGVGQITDFMPVGVRRGDPGYEWLIRRVSVSRGSMRFRAV